MMSGCISFDKGGLNDTHGAIALRITLEEHQIEKFLRKILLECTYSIYLRLLRILCETRPPNACSTTSKSRGSAFGD